MTTDPTPLECSVSGCGNVLHDIDESYEDGLCEVHAYDAATELYLDQYTLDCIQHYPEVAEVYRKSYGLTEL